MSIEAEARKYITDAIEIEKQMQVQEIREKARGRILLDSEEYDKMRKLLSNQIAQINSVANSDGKGRDDLGIEILIAAEGMLRRISPSQSKSVRKLAENIRTSFMNLSTFFYKKIGLLLRKYDNNIEVVDPQLKNNQDLVNALLLYEKYWERGKHYFQNGKICAQLIHFSSILEGILLYIKNKIGLAEKYKKFSELIDYRDTDIFVMIPMIMILKSCEGDDKGICDYFLPGILNMDNKQGVMYSEIKDVIHQSNNIFNSKDDNEANLSKSLRFGKRTTSFEKQRGDENWMQESKDNKSKILTKLESSGANGYKTLLKATKSCMHNQTKQPQIRLNYSFYNQLEKLVLNIELLEKDRYTYDIEKDKIDGVVHKIKILSIELERHDPQEWNTFLDVALEN